MCSEETWGRGGGGGEVGGTATERVREREEGGESRQIKWSEKCPHERELASSSSGAGEKEEIPPSADEIGFHTKTRREINSP